MLATDTHLQYLVNGNRHSYNYYTITFCIQTHLQLLYVLDTDTLTTYLPYIYRHTYIISAG